jgi:HK97 family phage major capsid protein
VLCQNPTQQIGAGMAELEIKAETIRYVLCASRELLEDASFNIETWALQKASQAIRVTVSSAILAGDGIGKPLGLLNGGIPICDTGANTPAGQLGDAIRTSGPR